METRKTEMCEEVGDELGRILDGSAPQELFDHIADCDHCRDLRHDASRAIETVKDAGGDFRPVEKLDERILSLLDARLAANTETKPRSAADSKPETVRKADAPARAEKGKEEAKEPKKALVPETAKEGAVVRFLRDPRGRLGFAGFALVAAAAAIAVVSTRGHGRGHEAEFAESAPWKGEVAAIARSTEGAGGVVVCDASGKDCAPIARGATFDAGATLRTDGHARAELKMADGTDLVLDRDSEIVFRRDQDRTARLVKGALVADVAHSKGGEHAKIDVPAGQVEVLGTKFAIFVDGDRSRVEVARGTVRLHDEHGADVDVTAGEEGRVAPNRGVSVAPSTRIADEIAWSERSFKPKTREHDGRESDEPLRGLGELRAKKPGQADENDTALRLAKHDVKVRIVDNFARTEIDETFQNDSSDELEGIYRFPLPPGAQIERLALEVNGKLEEGAFVDKDKAAAIWRGVIQHAAPKMPKPQEEIIWVPGPWRDPALLEWKRGGRFELRIFPIPAKGSRRVVLSYTETVQPVGGVRRYTYPLPYDPKGSTHVDAFHLDAQVLGHDRSQGVRARGYNLASVPALDANADRLQLTETKFAPSGDLTIEYALPNATSEVSAWAYQAPNDDAPYAVLALRPKLPKAPPSSGHDEILVVDASRSMVGERFARATAIAAEMVSILDGSDRVEVLACDTTCRAWDAGLAEAGAGAAEKARKFLGSVTPDGAADLAAMVRGARDAAKKADHDSSRPLHVVYVGDGGASSGPVKPDHLTAEIERILPGDTTVTAVAIGSDADTTLLAALTRAGGGVVVPYVPGQAASIAATAAVEATYGSSLRSPEVVLPSGFTAVAPNALDTIRAGGETLVLARMTAKDIDGEVTLRGKIGGDTFERKYPIHVVASTDAGNAFVPRLYAAARIADLERSGGDEAKTTIVDLSKRFAVASRYTSLLVLESEAMLHAFGVERAASPPAWTAETAATGSVAENVDAAGESEAQNSSADAPRTAAHTKGATRGGAGFDSFGGGGIAAAGPAEGAMAPSPMRLDDVEPAEKKAEKRKDISSLDGRAAAPAMGPQWGASDDRAVPPSAKPSPAPSTAAPGRRPPPPSPRRWIPMKRVWDRKGTIVTDNGAFHDRQGDRIVAAENALAAKPDSRQATKDLFALYAVAGRIEKAAEIADRWATRDALDPEAIAARADVAARMGDRDAAIRILGGVADVRPDDVPAQTRLAKLFDLVGDRFDACEHRITLAELHMSDVALVADAVKCARSEGMTDLADRISADVPAAKRAAFDAEMSKTRTVSDALVGDVRLEATWDSDADLDVGLVDKAGRRLSWLGGAAKVSTGGKSPTDPRGETVSFASLGAGTYLIEIDRAASSHDVTPIHGTLTVRAVGETRQIPFTLTGGRVEVGRIEISYTPRLVPVDG